MTAEELFKRMSATPLCGQCPGRRHACGHLFTPPIEDCPRRRLLELYNRELEQES